MRLIALSLVPELWEETLRALDALAPSARLSGPSKQDRYLFFQTLSAIWEENDRDQLTQRLHQYLLKALRESKRQTSWNHPNEDYEKSVAEFADSILSHPELPAALRPLCSSVARFGFMASLSQLMLKLLSPGIPDFYQGRELIDLSLVDPDNRRPVDYGNRVQLLDQIRHLVDTADRQLIQSWFEARDERMKLYVVAKLLKLRRELSSVFDGGAYQELKLEGSNCEDWIAFARNSEEQSVLVVVPSLRALMDERRDTRVVLDEVYRGRKWTEFLTHTDVAGTDVIDFQSFPFPWAVLIASDVR